MTDRKHFKEITEDCQNFLNLGIKIKNIKSYRDKSSINDIKKSLFKSVYSKMFV
jgi:hypothetical protein